MCVTMSIYAYSHSVHVYMHVNANLTLLLYVHISSGYLCTNMDVCVSSAASLPKRTEKTDALSFFSVFVSTSVSFHQSSLPASSLSGFQCPSRDNEYTLSLIKQD